MSTPVLQIKSPDVPRFEHALEETRTVIGRGTDCNLPIRDRYLSRKHAEILQENGEWVLRDCGSANGTYLNGTRVQMDTPLHVGDRIVIGDTSLVFQDRAGTPSSGSLELSDDVLAASIVIPLADLDQSRAGTTRETERQHLLATLALELIEEKPADRLFEMVVERIHAMLSASRTAIALFSRNSTDVHELIGRGVDQAPLTISRTLLGQVVNERNAVAYVDLSSDARFAEARSIAGQSIRSAVCAPLIAGDTVLGVLYVDFLVTQRDVADEDVRLLARIARLAATRLETARLREEELTKKRMEEDLRMAYAVQSRLLPSEPPRIPGYQVAGINRPARSVSGDYYDYVVRPDGRVYFVIADVAGKGIQAALVMASLATAFGLFAADDPSPATLVSKLNVTIAPKLTLGKFVTLFAGVLNPATGVLEFANAGHCPPLLINGTSTTELAETDLVLGIVATAKYRDQRTTIGPGCSLVLFTDGIAEAENQAGEELGMEPIMGAALAGAEGGASSILESILRTVRSHTEAAPQLDDITIVSVSRD